MSKKPQLRFFVVLSALWAVFLVLGPVAQAKSPSEGGRYFISSKNSLVKSLFGVQHEFKTGFTSDLTSGEVWTLEKIFKVSVTNVPLYKVSPVNTTAAETASANVLNDVIGGLTLDKSKQRTTAPDSPVVWGVKKIYNDESLKSTSGGKGVNVAVLDTGANIKHLDLTNQIKDCKDFTRGPIPRSTCEDKNGHGTHVAGIIAADGGFDGNGLWGMASEVNLFIYKVCRNDGTCWADDVAAGLDYAKDNSINVANMSLGGNVENPLLKDIIDGALKNNVLMVAAAGNDGPERGTINWPAAYPGACTQPACFGSAWDSNLPRSPLLPRASARAFAPFAAPAP